MKYIDDKSRCLQIREDISLNLYYIRRATEELTGSKLTHTIRFLNDKNKYWFYILKELECHGSESVHLTNYP